jgi:hypothetical protein
VQSEETETWSWMGWMWGIWSQTKQPTLHWCSRSQHHHTRRVNSTRSKSKHNTSLQQKQAKSQAWVGHKKYKEDLNKVRLLLNTY